MGPWTSETRHLTFHVWPTLRSDCWEWNLRQLATRWRLFNGKKVIGIAVDKQTATADAVLQFAEALGMRFDAVIEVNNNPRLREVTTFVPMLRAVGMPCTDPAAVVFSAHAKGAQYENGSYTRQWTELMFASCLDYWPLVEQHLRHAMFTGSFREFGLLGRWHDWAYSGTFYWWRPAAVSLRDWSNVDQWFAGTESWPGKICSPRETRCLFLNDNRRLYDSGYLQDVVLPEWEKWQRKMERMSNAHRGI